MLPSDQRHHLERYDRGMDRFHALSHRRKERSALGAFQKDPAETIGVQVEFQVILMLAVRAIHGQILSKEMR